MTERIALIIILFGSVWLIMDDLSGNKKYISKIASKIGGEE